jgi:xanthine dehydrogenase accessory factor
MTETSVDSDTAASILLRAIEWKEAGHRVVLATIVRAWPTAARRAGSQMAVREDGERAGSVFGAGVDAQVAEAAAAALVTMGDRKASEGRQRQQPRRGLFQLMVDDATANGAGLACGGPLEVRFEVLGHGDANDDGAWALLRDTLAAVQARRSVVLCTGLVDGRRLLVEPDPITGPSTGSDDPWHAEALRHARGDESGIAVAGGDEVLFQVFNAPLRLFVVGAVRAARALLDASRLVGFEVSVVDPRPERMASLAFAQARTVVADAGDTLAEARLDARSAVVFLSHAPEIDDPGLHVALRSPAFYIGALGSRRTHAARLERLAQAGVTPQAAARIHGPVGLAIGAIGPAEIAASIVAEMIGVLRQGAAFRKSG